MQDCCEYHSTTKCHQLKTEMNTIMIYRITDTNYIAFKTNQHASKTNTNKTKTNKAKAETNKIKIRN